MLADSLRAADTERRMAGAHIYNFQMLHFIGLEMNKWRTSHIDTAATTRWLGKNFA